MPHTLAFSDEAPSRPPVPEQIVAEVPQALLDTPARDTLRRVVGALPAALVRPQLGLEFSLQGRSTVEVFVATVPNGSDRELLDRALRSDAAGAGPALSRLASAVSEWRNAESWLARSCAFLLLGYGAAAGPNDGPLPSGVFLAPRHRAHAGANPAVNTFHTDPFGMLSALSAIADVPLSYRVCADLKTVMDNLPERAEMFSAGVVPSGDRPPARRVALKNVRAAEVGPFLRRSNRTRAAKTLGRVANALADVSPDMCVALDVGPDAADAAELRVAATGAGADWAALVDMLVHRKLADPARADAVRGLIDAAEGERPTTTLRHVKITAVVHTFAPTRICVGFGGLR